MKNVMIVTPTAVGTSSASRWKTKDIRPMWTSLGGVGVRGSAGGAGRCSAPGTAVTAVLAAGGRSARAEPDVLHVVIAERGDVEAVHVRRLDVLVRRVVQEREEGVLRRQRLGGVVVGLASRGGGGQLGVVHRLHHGRVAVAGEERL